MADVTVDIKQLLEAGAHFGHQTSRWHPAMDRYIHSKRDGTHIIDLTQTVEGLEKALKFVEEVVAQGKQVLLVGTKRQAQGILKQTAEETSMPYVTERWLGGMLTNGNTVNGRIKHLKDLEERMLSGELASRYNKLEVQRLQQEIDDMNLKFGGIKFMNGKPGAVFVVDVPNELNAIAEARKLHIPVIALVDTNADPKLVDYVIPCNDDAVKTIQLVCDYLKVAISNGKSKGSKDLDKTEKPADVAAASVATAATTVSPEAAAPAPATAEAPAGTTPAAA